MTTGPGKAQGAMYDTSADVPGEGDIRETRDEQYTPEVVHENAPEAAAREDTGYPGDMAPREDTGYPGDIAPHEETGDLGDMGPREEAPSIGATGTSTAWTGAAGAGTLGGGEVDADVGGPLLTEAEELRSSWHEIQAGFVDDPRGSVAQAAMMVEETAETLVATIQERERVLRGTWEGNGAAADTEKLRIALCKYRTFFEKITRL